MHKVVNTTSAKTTALAAVVSCLYALQKNLNFSFLYYWKKTILETINIYFAVGFNFLSVLQSANKCTGDFYLFSPINSSCEVSWERSVGEMIQCVVCIITMFV